MAPYSAEFQPDRHPSLSLSSGASFSSSLDSDIDSNVVLHLAPLPIQLPDRPQSPYDQAIPSILHEVTGAEDLRSVLELKLKVLSSEFSLSRLHIYVPQIMILDLSGSFLQSLRDLGCSLTNLKVLKVDRCSLESLDGVFGLSSVIELSAAYNRIEDLSPAIFLENLKTLNLRGNCIPDLSFLELIRDLPLENLTLAENPASRSSNFYSQTVLSVLRQLKMFDGKPLTPPTPEPLLPPIDRQPDCWAIRTAPLPNAQPQSVTTNRPQSARPASSGPLARKLQRTFSLTDILKETLEISSSVSSTREELSPVSRLTSGGIVCGNLANALRHRIRRLRPEHVNRREDVMQVEDVESVDKSTDESCAVPSSCSEMTSPPTTSSTASSSSSIAQESTDSSSSSSLNDLSIESSSNNLMSSSKRWRQAFSMFQEKSSLSWRNHSIEIEEGDNAAADATTTSTDDKDEDDNNITDVSK